MKRKFKLITSVASLCLAVALMAFGVYAATAPSVTVNGTVSFSATNVYATVAVAKKDGQPEAGFDAAAWTPVDTETKFDGSTTDANKDASYDVALTLTDANVKAGYKVTVTSDHGASSEVGVKVKVSQIVKLDKPGYTYTVSYKRGAEAEVTSVDVDTEVVLNGGETVEFVITVKVDPAVANASLTNEPITLKLDLSRGAKRTA